MKPDTKSVSISLAAGPSHTPRDTHKEMVSLDRQVIEVFLDASKFRHASTRLNNEFISLLEVHVKQNEVYRVRDLLRIIFEFGVQCMGDHESIEDFADSVEFSREEIDQVLNGTESHSLAGTLQGLQELAERMEEHLLELRLG